MPAADPDRENDERNLVFRQRDKEILRRLRRMEENLALLWQRVDGRRKPRLDNSSMNDKHKEHHGK